MWGEGGRVGCGASYIQAVYPVFLVPDTFDALPILPCMLFGGSFVAPCEDRGCKIVWPEPYA